MCISEVKNLETIWKELVEEFEEELKWLNITVDSIWNTARERKMKHPFTQFSRVHFSSWNSSA